MHDPTDMTSAVTMKLLAALTWHQQMVTDETDTYPAPSNYTAASKFPLSNDSKMDPSTVRYHRM
jgi:hypothetical protein